MNVLVTAIGSPLGQSIAKASLLAGFHTLGGDADPRSTNLNAKLRIVELPHCREKNYLKKLLELLADEDISFYLPSLHPEIQAYYAAVDAFAKLPVQVGVINQGTYSVMNHKLACSLYLQSLDIAVPLSCSLAEEPPFDGPWIIKPTNGISGRGIYRAADKTQLQHLKAYLDSASEGYLVQQDLGDQYDEYTSGVFKSNESITCIHMRRQLKFGLSYKTETVSSPLLDDYCTRIAESFDFIGSVNIQFKLVDGHPYCFEINPRFSSTTGIRAHQGFNEVAMFWQAINNKVIARPSIRPLRCYRYWEEEYHE